MNSDTWKFDLAIAQFSKLRLLIMMIWLLTILLMLFLSDLLLWQWLLILGITTVVLYFISLRRLAIVHLVKSGIDSSTVNWHLYIDKKVIIDADIGHNVVLKKPLKNERILNKLVSFLITPKAIIKPKTSNDSVRLDGYLDLILDGNSNSRYYNHDTAVLWQASLSESYDFGFVIVIRFNVFEPVSRQLILSIWQDQVQEDDWRKLKTMACL